MGSFPLVSVADQLSQALPVPLHARQELSLRPGQLRIGERAVALARHRAQAAAQFPMQLPIRRAPRDRLGALIVQFEQLPDSIDPAHRPLCQGQVVVG